MLHWPICTLLIEWTNAVKFTCVIVFTVQFHWLSINQQEIMALFKIKLFNVEKDAPFFERSIFNSHYNFTVCVVPIGRVARTLNAPSLSPVFLWAGVWRRERERTMRTLTTVGRHIHATTEHMRTAGWMLGFWPNWGRIQDPDTGNYICLSITELVYS